MEPFLITGALVAGAMGIQNALVHGRVEDLAPDRPFFEEHNALIEKRTEDPHYTHPRISRACLEPEKRLEADVYDPVYGHPVLGRQAYQYVKASIFDIRFDPWTGDRIMDDDTRTFVTDLVFDMDRRAIKLVGLYDSRNGLPVKRHCR